MKQKKYIINVENGNKKLTLNAASGKTLMHILAACGIYIDSPCGGKCLCGKCKIKVLKGNAPQISSEEAAFLSSKEISEGVRLACALKITDNLDIQLISMPSEAKIMADYGEIKEELNPYIHKSVLNLKKPDINDQRDHVQRIKDALGKEQIKMDLDIVRELAGIFENNSAVNNADNNVYNSADNNAVNNVDNSTENNTDNNAASSVDDNVTNSIINSITNSITNSVTLTVSHNDDEIIKIEKGDTSHIYYGVAIDIGTTTVVAYLVDLYKGTIVDAVSRLNAQRPYGADVISRINYTVENSQGLNLLNQKIIVQLNDMIKKLAFKNKINIDNILNISIVGNTTMLHLLLGLNPANIAVSPFIPVITEGICLKSQELGLKVNDACRVTIFPSISAYVGADILAGIMSSHMMESSKPSLLIDIGTNGEIALGNKDMIICCSTAAGPAFEGANIKNGMGGVSGAINTITIENGVLKYTTIDYADPIGICGSGIIDAIAALLENGLIDETGRYVDKDFIKSKEAIKLSERFIAEDGEIAFRLADTPNKNAIVLTQKDIREVQLAKAAIAAGINVLVKKMDIKTEDIDKVYLAGGFGSYMNKKNAVKIGLIPKILEDRIKVIGNAAGAGAIMSLLSKECLKNSSLIKNKAKYIELSASPEFQEEYIECMYFE